MVGKDGCQWGGMACEWPLGLVDRTTWAKGVSGGLSFLLGGGFGEGVSVRVWTLGNECGVIGDRTGCGMMVTELVSWLEWPRDEKASPKQSCTWLSGGDG